MYRDELDIATLFELGEDEGQDCALKSVPRPSLSRPFHALEPGMLTGLGVVVWASNSGLDQRFFGGGGRTFEC